MEAIAVAGADVLPVGEERLIYGLVPAYKNVGDAVLLQIVFAVLDIMREKNRKFRDPLAYFFKLLTHKMAIRQSDNKAVVSDSEVTSSASSSYRVGSP